MNLKAFGFGVVATLALGGAAYGWSVYRVPTQVLRLDCSVKRDSSALRAESAHLREKIAAYGAQWRYKRSISQELLDEGEVLDQKMDMLGAEMTVCTAFLTKRAGGR